jgi:hypothetical protein
MTQKKSFILELPFFLATDAGSLPVKLMFATCYLLLVISYAVPLIGTLLVSACCLAFWQFFNIITKNNYRYKIYFSFLLQRLVFCNVFVVFLFIFCSYEVEFNQAIWNTCSILLALLNFSDIYFAVKGFIGVAYIDKKHKN